MRGRTIIVVSVVLAAAALVWSLRLHEPATPGVYSTTDAETGPRNPAPQPSSPEAEPRSAANDHAIDVAERASFNEEAREFFARAPALPPDEARRRGEALSQELTRIEQAGGLSAGETFLLRVGLIRATEPDEQQQAARIRALKERYEADSRRRGAQADAQSDPMFELYKVRESEIVAEVMALETIPDGLSRDEYLRRRLQAEREQVLAD